MLRTPSHNHLSRYGYHGSRRTGYAGELKNPF
jgi:hypothetical protein